MSGGSIHHGTPGGSARREHERRKRGREERTRERFPRAGGLVLALSEEPQHEKSWATGALGEELVAAALRKRCHDGVVVLHDLRVPGSRANIDHIAVSAAGVWVIDAKRYKGRVVVRKPLFGSATLQVGRRDKTPLVAGLHAQVELVERLVTAVRPETLVRGAFCFVESELPLLGTPSIDGLLIVGRRGLASRINARGPLGPEAVREVADELVGRLSPA